MKRKILLPTDFSDNAWSAAVYALKLYTDEECSFYFLHALIIVGAPFEDLSNKLLKTMEEDAMNELLDLKALAERGNANANHDFHIILSTKDLNTAIKDAIKKHDINLIIMGTKGATGAKEFFFGSNTVRVINKANCPVLLIPEDYDFIEPKQIAFPTDYNRFYDIKEIEPLVQLTNLYDSKIRIVHINEKEELNDVQDYNLMELQSHLNDYDYSLHWMPNYAKKVVEINDFIEELDIDILVMVNYKHSFIEKIVKEPVIKKIGFQSKIPFLVIPE
ncbi:MAG: universal stress protein [Algibacter sp.]|uniref:universal stress protein n=1 Tax=Algibacter sp. TaxID=1872428 RepID=UPI0026249B0B|nr:universal stress protein [Algibacter sp.]MDG1730385.1 universal stress protein [Algibacter sp.]MDG2178863.1 universal stress protein [Algibacter sp.]